MTELTKEQLIDLITDKVYYRSKEKYVKSEPLRNQHLYNISLKLEDLAKTYKEKFNEEMPTNLSAHGVFADCLFENCVFDHIPFNVYNFSECGFYNCTFEHCDLRDATIDQSEMCETHITHCNLTNTLIRKSNIIGAVVLKSKFYHTSFMQSSILNTKFTETDFTMALWLQLNLKHDDFHDCTLKYIHIYLSSWTGSTCTGTTEWDNTSSIEKLFLNGGVESPIKNHFISVNNIGSRLDNTYYDYENDRVICGCWREDHMNNYYGGSLDAFKERVKKIYPEGRYHDEYMRAIKIFRFAREDYLKSLESQE